MDGLYSVAPLRFDHFARDAIPDINGKDNDA